MQKLTGILVCDSGKAKYFINKGPNDGVHLQEEWGQEVPGTHDIMTGGRGRNSQRNGLQGRHAYEAEHDPRELYKEQFVRDIAQMIEAKANGIHQLIIAAPPKTLHILREALPVALQNKLIAEIPKDLTHETERTLPRFLETSLNLRTTPKRPEPV